MRKAKVICFEGVEGCGKSTHAQKLVEHLMGKGLKVLQTKEPGTPLSPLTMELRNIILNAKYDSQLTVTARELITQAIRSIHLEKVIIPALEKYDYIIQDRGILSGLSYGRANGNQPHFLKHLTDQVILPTHTIYPRSLYNKVIYLRTESSKGLARARGAKQEFKDGDVMEMKGEAFLRDVARHMEEYLRDFNHCIINVDGKSVDENFKEILENLQLGEDLE